MALAATTLAADLAIDSLTLYLTSASTAGLPGVGVYSAQSFLIKINGEFMRTITGICQPQTNVIKIRMRGDENTVAKAHDILSDVVAGLPSDFPVNPPGSLVVVPPGSELVVSYGEDGAIAVPVANTTALLNKATAGAYTLAAPTKAQNGTFRLVLTSQTAAAHVVTATSLLGDAVSGSPHTTATFAAFIGASLTLEPSDGIWNVISSTGITIT